MLLNATRTTRWATACVAFLVFAFLVLADTSAGAKPEYARKEGRACQYCHISASPGYVDPASGVKEPITRNERGRYYSAHNHSFAGYSEKSVISKQPPLLFHLAWSEELTDLPRRMAVADVTGDGTPRLVTLNEKPGSPNTSTLTVKKWDGKAFATEFSGEVQTAADRLAVGRFAGVDKPPVIVTGDALWQWNGTTYLRKPSPRPLAIVGGTRLKDGTERLIIVERETDTEAEVRAWRINDRANDGGWLIDPLPAPRSAQLQWGDFHGTPAFLDKLGMPTLLGGGGIVGLWDVRKFDMLFLYYAKVLEDIDIAKDETDPKNPKPKFISKSRTGLVAFRNPMDSQGGELWLTPRLNGAVYDIGQESAKGDKKTGLLVLTSESASGKGRALVFFALD